MSRAGREHGAVALAAALAALLAASLLAAAVAEIARTELVLAQDRRTFAHGLAAADACLARVTAALPAGWDQAALIAGVDGITGTTDDGILSAPSGCAAHLIPGPLGTLRPFLDVAVSVTGGGRRVRAIIAPTPAPVPAVVWVASGTGLGFASGRLVIDGRDPARPDLRPLPGIASPDDPVLVDDWLAATPAVSLAGATAAPEYAPAPPFVELTGRLLGAGALGSFAPAPTAPPTALHVVPGDLTIASTGFGAGILYVDGHLDIVTNFAFNGVVAARGGVGVANGVTVRVAGGIWVGAPAFDVRGDLVVTHDRAALDAAAALLPFPRRPTIAGLVDR